MINDWLQNYVAEQHRALDSVPLADIAKVVELVLDAHERDARIFAVGNGGSAANASHFATDLGKSASDARKKRFRVTSLTDNVPWITALGNDYEYADVFVRQLQIHAEKGDLLIATGVSGSSPNVVKAFEWARKAGVKTVALVGANRGRLPGLADVSVVVEDSHYGRVEDVQMHILHMVCYAFIEGAAGA